MTPPRATKALPTHRSAWWLALAALSLALLAPLLVVDVPPLADYPNHLARAFVLASLPGDTVLGRFYAPHWSIIPNLGFDLIAPPLMHILPVHVVGRLLIGASLLLPVLGAIAYNTALGGRWWSLGAGLVAYNGCLLYGFLNFQLSIGLALLLAAAWLHWRDTRSALAILLALVGTPVLFACHLMGLLFFALLVGSAELVALHRLTSRRRTRTTLRRGAVLLLVFAAPVALYAMTALQHLGGDAEFVTPLQKALQLGTPLANYDPRLDALTAIVVIGLIAFGLATRTATFPPQAGFAIGVIAAVYLAAPFAWKGTYLLDTRFAVMFGFMLFAGLVPARLPPGLAPRLPPGLTLHWQPHWSLHWPPHWPPGRQPIAATALTLLFVIRMALLTTVWADHRTDLADLRRVLQPVQPGQAVYVAELGLHQRPDYWRANPHWRLLYDGFRLDEHLGALALIEHRAYWPFEFDMPSQQPISTLEPYRSLAERVGFMPTWARAAVANVCGFDYVLLLEADAMPDLPADRFRLLVRSGFAALYAVTQCKETP